MNWIARRVRNIWRAGQLLSGLGLVGGLILGGPARLLADQNKATGSATNAMGVKIAAIGTAVANIERDMPKLKRVAAAVGGQGVGGGEWAGYFQGKSLHKAVQDVFDGSGRTTAEVYFQGGEPIFIMRTTLHYQRPFQFDEKANDLETDRRIQERGWYEHRQLMAVSGGDGKWLAAASPEARTAGKQLMETAAEAVRALSKAQATSLSQGENETKHPVEAKVEALAAGGGSTAEETALACMAAKLWDDELNRVYRELRGKLEPADAGKLQEAQRKWVAWRDAESELSDSLYGEQPGTMFQPMNEQHRMNLVKARALELQHWLELQENYLDHRREMDEIEKGLK